MTDFIPPGYAKLTDFKDPELRHKLAAGELKATVWNPETGGMFPVVKEAWLGRFGPSMIETGHVLYQDPPMIKPVPLPVLIEVKDQPAPAANGKRRGPRPIERNRVKAEILKVGLRTVVDDPVSLEAKAARFGTTVYTFQEALKELQKETPKELRITPKNSDGH